jgi:hypothetical protein
VIGERDVNPARMKDIGSSMSITSVAGVKSLSPSVVVVVRRTSRQVNCPSASMDLTSRLSARRA